MHQNLNVTSHLKYVTGHGVTKPVLLEYAPKFKYEIMKFSNKTLVFEAEI
jgi:hypothetical protein